MGGGQYQSQNVPATAGNADAGNVAITEKEVDGSVDDVLWSGQENDIIYLLSSRGVVFRSSDGGKTWVNQMPRLQQMEWTAMGRSSGPSRMTGMLKSPADSNVVVLLGSDGQHAITRDGGRSYIPMGHSQALGEVKLHPTEPLFILAASLSPRCGNPAADGYCFKSLFLSKDGGSHWKLLKHYVVQFEWVWQLERSAGETYPMDSIFATVMRTMNTHQPFGTWDHRMDFVISTDQFASTRVVIPRGNRFLFTDRYIAVAQVDDPVAAADDPAASFASQSGPAPATSARKTLPALNSITSSSGNRYHVRLLLSPDGGHIWREARMPFEMLQHSFTILDTSEGSIFLHVNHEGPGAQWGNVYLSNALGTNFALSLPYNRRDEHGKCDFEKLQSMEGVYVANFYSNAEELTRAAEAEKQDGLPMGSQQTTRSIAQRKRLSKKSSKQPTPKIRTVISFDKGGVWEYLHPPKTTASGQPLRCPKPGKDHCSLHLHGVTDVYGPFYSTPNAVGLLMATGCVGSHLCMREGEINTYFSRDGGHEWFEVAQGSHIYEFGDHGGLIVMAFDERPVTQVYFTWNEGMTWSPLTLTNNPVLVDNIMIEPTATSTRFIVYGTRREGAAKTGVVFHLDFSELHPRPCIGVDMPDTDESDYETWRPSASDHQEGCLLGHETEYVRRKRDRMCFNEEADERKHVVRHCACTEQDYECDYGYVRHLDGGPCLRDPAVELNVSQVAPFPCPPGSNFLMSNGYRKIAGDTCVGGVQHSMAWVPCPNTKWHHKVSHGGWFVLGMLLLMAVAMFALTFLQRKQRYPNETFFGYTGHAFRTMCGMVVLAFSACWGFFRYFTSRGGFRSPSQPRSMPGMGSEPSGSKPGLSQWMTQWMSQHRGDGTTSEVTTSIEEMAQNPPAWSGTSYAALGQGRGPDSALEDEEDDFSGDIMGSGGGDMHGVTARKRKHSGHQDPADAEWEAIVSGAEQPEEQSAGDLLGLDEEDLGQHTTSRRRATGERSSNSRPPVLPAPRGPGEKRN